jgi:hypothetical protein
MEWYKILYLPISLAYIKFVYERWTTYKAQNKAFYTQFQNMQFI